MNGSPGVPPRPPKEVAGGRSDGRLHMTAVDALGRETSPHRWQPAAGNVDKGVLGRLTRR